MLLRIAYEVLLGDHRATTSKERLARRLIERFGLSVARNKIVHEGDLTLLDDATAGSVYAGPYWRVASRVLRDVILVEARRWGFAGMWDSVFGRAGRQAIAKLASEE